MFDKQGLLKRLNLFTGLLLIVTLSACHSNAEETQETVSNDNGINYSEAVNYTITGIEPGAGLTISTENVLEEYDNLSGWELDLSSTAGMLVELETAIENEDPIIVTGWKPHWMFAQYPELKYLDDPKGTYGGEDSLRTLVREGLEEEKPNAFKLLDQFKWELEDMNGIMNEAEETGGDITKIAKQWVDDHPEKVAEWTDGVDEGNGVEIEIASIPWDSERASAGVIEEVLTQQGFDVTITPVDVAIVFESIANGDADATLAPMLPTNHKEFYEQYKDDVIDLGPNLEGAKNGLVVPDYMDIDSIEDLEPAK